MNLAESLKKGLQVVTRDFTKAKRKAAADHRDELTRSEMAQLIRMEKEEEKNAIKTAAHKHMTTAYMAASDGNSLPATARQIFYKARPLILAELNITELSDTYFTQHLLPDYMQEYAEETKEWDVVFDARGHFTEPHTSVNFGIGTIEVRDYVGEWRRNSADTYGPENRYQYALFIEKEGFASILAESKIAEKYDVAIFSSKGQSTTATRTLVEALSNAGVTILVVHDFDISGLSICHNLSHDTRRYQFQCTPSVIDLGLRLEDIKKMRLPGEPTRMKQLKSPAERLWEYEIADEEADYLVRPTYEKGTGDWIGQRVELNAMSSRQFIDWLESKLQEHGVEKVIPDMELLGPVWQRHHQAVAYEKFSAERIKQIRREFEKQYRKPKPPRNLPEQVQEYLESDLAEPWDVAVKNLAKRTVG